MDTNNYKILSIGRQLEEIEDRLSVTYDFLHQFHKENNHSLETLQIDIAGLKSARNRLENNLRELENK